MTTDPRRPEATVTTGLKSFTKAQLDAMPRRAGSVARCTDDIRGIWMDNGTGWASTTGVATVTDWGAIGNSVAAHTTEVQAALDLLVSGSHLHFPASPGVVSGGLYDLLKKGYHVDAALDVPIKDLRITGDGIQTTVIRQLTAGVNLFGTASTWAGGGTSNQTFQDMRLESFGTTSGTRALYGIELEAIHQSHILQVRFNGFTSGIHSLNCYIVNIENCVFAGGQYGIEDEPSTGTESNAWSVAGCEFVSQSDYAMYLKSNPNKYSIVRSNFQSCAKGAIRITKGNVITIDDNYFESNLNGVDASFSVSLGDVGQINGGSIRNNWMASSVTDTTHYPIRIYSCKGVVIDGNVVNNGSRYISFENSAINNCRFGRVVFNDGTAVVKDPTSAQATYKSLPNTFIYNGNVMEDYDTFPNDGHNYVTHDFPFNWNLGGGTATFRRSPDTGSAPDAHNGRPVGVINYTAGAAATIYQTIAANATSNSRIRGNWVTFLVDVYVDTNSTGFNLSLSGSDTTISTASYTASPADGWKTYSVCAYVGTSEAALVYKYSATGAAKHLLANPRVYVGLDPRSMIGIMGFPRWVHSSAPTDGTWAEGDVVWENDMSAGAPILWTCSTAGTPGVWVASANAV